jgi:lysyl-tRNA synthetase class 1
MPPAPELGVTFALLLNLAAVSNTEDKAMLWSFLRRYAPSASPETEPRLDRLAGYAVAYYRDFVKPAKTYRAATSAEAKAMRALDAALAAAPKEADSKTLQDLVTETGKANGYTPETLRSWYQALYQVLLGQTEGPRIGPFIALYGIAETRALIAKGLAGKLIAKD